MRRMLGKRPSTASFLVLGAWTRALSVVCVCSFACCGRSLPNRAKIAFAGGAAPKTPTSSSSSSGGGGGGGVAHHATPVPPPPSVSVPVWSFASPLSNTRAEELGGGTETRTSMSIVTFATPVSVATPPPKLWIVSLYRDTLTRRAFLDSGVGTLQLLSIGQSALVPVLGKRSGRDPTVPKRDACASAGHAWTSTTNDDDDDDDDGAADLLPGCRTYLRVRLVDSLPAGDHDACLVEVVRTLRWDETEQSVVPRVDDDPPPSPEDETTALYTARLRAEGIL